MELVSTLLRNAYPLQSGLGTIANSKFFKQLDGNLAVDTIARVGNFSLVVPQNDHVGRSIKYFGDLDRKVTWVVHKVLQQGDTALDIGANLGLMSFHMLQRVGSAGKVIAFEPQSRMVNYIEKSIARNGIENLHLQKVGLAEKRDTLRLAIPEDNAGAASFAEESGARFEHVPVTTLDDFHREHDLNSVRLIKIDVEGFEAKVFAGGTDYLTKMKPDVIVFEENASTDERPPSIAICQSYGYDVYYLPKALFTVTLRPYYDGAVAHDFVAIHKDAPDDLRRSLGVV